MRSLKSVIVVELLIVVALCYYNRFAFSITTLLWLFASHSLWTRGLGWPSVGLTRPESWWKAAAQGVLAAVGILVVFLLLLMPLATRLAGEPIDVSMFDVVRANGPVLVQWLALAWFFAALGEEMVFRAYLMHRIVDLVGTTRAGWLVALLGSSAIFSLPHGYQGVAGMINAGVIGLLIGGLYWFSKRNLWPAIICHGMVDSLVLVAVYLELDTGLVR